MGLCGSFRCGCGVTSTPATDGAVGGELPTINVAGSGEPGDPYDLTLNDAWAVEVADALTTAADQLANLPPAIQHGEASDTTNGSGAVTVTFPDAFTAAPTLVCTARSTNDRLVVVNTITATNFTLTLYDLSTGTFVASASVNANWIAIGTLA